MSQKKILINDTLIETRIALLEDDRLAEIICHRRTEQRRVGNIYKGIVKRVLPGMNSAFIDIGAKDKAAFLFGGDAYSQELETIATTDESDEWPATPTRNISEILHQGQEILVQVNKEALGTKGPRVTMHLTLPGRNLVYLPLVKHIGVSRRIEDKPTREKLKKVLTTILPESGGVIARTAAFDTKVEVLQSELETLQNSWILIAQTANAARAPSLVHHDMNIVTKTIRDLFDSEVSEVITDNPSLGAKLETYLSELGAESSKILNLHRQTTPLFDDFGIEMDLANALRPRVDLPSGGYLIIEQTEALTSIDVNTGRYVGRSSISETILKTNLEAAQVAVEQFRVRNLGGIIIIDFIDMENGEHRERVYLELTEQLKKDRAKTNVLRISEFGLLEMTRKRTHKSLSGQLMTECSYCDGYGKTRSKKTEILDLIREVERRHQQTFAKKIQVYLREDLFQTLTEEFGDYLNFIRKKYMIEVDFNLAKPEHMCHISFEVKD